MNKLFKIGFVVALLLTAVFATELMAGMTLWAHHHPDRPADAKYVVVAMMVIGIVSIWTIFAFAFEANLREMFPKRINRTGPTIAR